MLALYVQTLTQIHSGTLLYISVLDVLKPKGMGGGGGGEGRRWASQYYIWALVVPRAWLCVSRTPKMRLENPLHLQFQSKNFSLSSGSYSYSSFSALSFTPITNATSVIITTTTTFCS